MRTRLYAAAAAAAALTLYGAGVAQAAPSARHVPAVRTAGTTDYLLQNDNVSPHTNATDEGSGAQMDMTTIENTTFVRASSVNIGGTVFYRYKDPNSGQYMKEDPSLSGRPVVEATLVTGDSSDYAKEELWTDYPSEDGSGGYYFESFWEEAGETGSGGNGGILVNNANKLWSNGNESSPTGDRDFNLVLPSADASVQAQTLAFTGHAPLHQQVAWSHAQGVTPDTTFTYKSLDFSGQCIEDNGSGAQATLTSSSSDCAVFPEPRIGFLSDCLDGGGCYQYKDEAGFCLGKKSTSSATIVFAACATTGTAQGLQEFSDPGTDKGSDDVLNQYADNHGVNPFLSAVSRGGLTLAALDGAGTEWQI